MILAEKKTLGTSVKIGSADIVDVMDELQAILIAVRNVFTKEVGEEMADQLIAVCGQLAFTDDHEEKVNILKELSEELEKSIVEEVV